MLLATVSLVRVLWSSSGPEAKEEYTVYWVATNFNFYRFSALGVAPPGISICSVDAELRARSPCTRLP